MLKGNPVREETGFAQSLAGEVARLQWENQALQKCMRQASKKAVTCNAVGARPLADHEATSWRRSTFLA
jgi:hypothetical protein